MHETSHSVLSSPKGNNVEKAYEAFLARLSPKAKMSAEKHFELCAASAELGFGRWWMRLAGSLGRSASHAIEITGQQAIRFYIADGKYRQQVFALEDARKGVINIYMPDVIELAISKKILKAAKAGEHVYPVVGTTGTIELEQISSETKDVPDVCKSMLGWGRRAIRSAVSVNAEEAQVIAIEKISALAAEAWPKAQAASVA